MMSILWNEKCTARPEVDVVWKNLWTDVDKFVAEVKVLDIVIIRKPVQ